MKRYRLLIIGLVLILAGWYFLKNYNYKISFTTPHPTGTVFTTLTKWNIAEITEVDSVQLINFPDFSTVEQRVFIKDSVFDYHWKIEQVDQSSTKVTAFVKDNHNSFTQNLQAIFSRNDFVKRNISLVENLMNGLYIHEKAYKVRVEPDIQKLEKQFCACIELESTTFQKGNNMMKDIGLVMYYLNDNNIPLVGDPFVKLTSWDRLNELISYDFCFPVQPRDSFPPSEAIKFKYTSEISGLRAIFNGNYKLTDNAWYEMIDYAEANGIKLKGHPLEIYRDDPHVGVNEIEWVAEVWWAVENAPE